jgi:hypothetical protein
MKYRLATTVLSTLVGLIVLLAAAGLVLVVTLAVAEIHQPVAHALAVAAALLFGTGALVGAVFLATHVAVHLVGEAPES